MGYSPTIGATILGERDQELAEKAPSAKCWEMKFLLKKRPFKKGSVSIFKGGTLYMFFACPLNYLYLAIGCNRHQPFHWFT